MDWQKLSGIDWSPLIDGFSNDVDDSSESLGSNWNHDGVSSIVDLLASNKTFSRVKSDGSHIVSSQVLGDFKNKSVWYSLDLKGVENWWEVSLELDINDGTNDLGNFPNSHT
jgi:hypothetical protein